MPAADLLLEARTLAAKRWVIAFSGGMDSTVLLHWLAEHSAGLELLAVHVNHGLQRDAERWVDHCREQCLQAAVPFAVETVNVDVNAGDGMEGAARKARYAALAKHVDKHTALFMAHHADDQAESVLLAMMRGSGIDGLAAMPHVRTFAEGHLVRPLLTTSRADLQQWAGDRQLAWLDDPSNADTRLRRNFLRHEVIPLLEQQWPAARKNLGRVAALQAEQRGLLESWAAQLLSDAQREETLCLSYLRQLSIADQKLLVRHWLRSRGVPLPSQQHWQGLQELLHAAADKSPVWHYPGGELRRFQNRLYVVTDAEPPPPGEWGFDAGLCCTLPNDLGRFCLIAVEAESPDSLLLSAASLAKLRLRFRRGGERFLQAGQHKQLKQWFQQRVPPWQRNNTPLLMSGEELLAFGETVLVSSTSADSEQRWYRLQWHQPKNAVSLPPE